MESDKKAMWTFLAGRGMDHGTSPIWRQESKKKPLFPEPVFFNVYGAQESFQGINSARLCSLVGQYDKPIPILGS